MFKNCPPSETKGFVSLRIVINLPINTHTAQTHTRPPIYIPYIHLQFYFLHSSFSLANIQCTYSFCSLFSHAELSVLWGWTFYRWWRLAHSICSLNVCRMTVWMNISMNDGFYFSLKSWVGVEVQLFWLRLSWSHGTGTSPLSSRLPVYLAVWSLWKAGGSGWKTKTSSFCLFFVVPFFQGEGSAFQVACYHPLGPV